MTLSIIRKLAKIFWVLPQNVLLVVQYTQLNKTHDRILRKMSHKNEEKKDPSEPISLEEALQSKLSQEKKLLGQDLDSDERTIVESIGTNRKNRLILDRIYIIFNQTRKNLALDLKTKSELREKLTSLAEKGYIRIEGFIYEGEEREAFILTEQGEELVK